jgi:hypothetical protein
MRLSRIALLCGLAAVAALLVWRGGDERREAQYAPVTPTPARPEQLPVPAASSPGAASAASGVAAAPEKSARPEAGRPRSPFALSSDHQALIQQAVIARADHELLEHEPRDDAWATKSELLIRQELARDPNAGNFDVISLECRQTMCAVQAFSYGDNSHRKWVDAMDDLLFTDSLAPGFDMVNTAFPTYGGRRSTVLTFFHRRTVKPQP